MSGSNPTRQREHRSSGLGAPPEAPYVDDVDGDGVDDVDCVEEPAWCVELGSSLAAMSTAEIVAAVGGGHISAAARVWREGLECWTRIYDVPELFALLYGVETDLATPPAVEIASRGSASHGAWTPRAVEPVEAPSFAAAGLFGASRSDAPREGTPSPVPVAHSVRFGDDAAANPARSRRKLARGMGGGGGGGRDARWIAGGLCVAAAAIGVALVQGPSAPEPKLARAEHRLEAIEQVAEVARAAAARAGEAIDRATISRTEPGQRRLRGGAGRPRKP